MAKPRTAQSSAPKTVQAGTPADVPAVTEEKTAGSTQAQDGLVPEEGRGELQPAETVASASDGAAIDQLPPGKPEGSQIADIEASRTWLEAAVSIDAAAAPATSTAGTDDAPNTWLFEVLSPFKHNGVVVKPPAWIEMAWDEAEDYQDAGVLGDEPATPEELE